MDEGMEQAESPTTDAATEPEAPASQETAAPEAPEPAAPAEHGAEARIGELSRDLAESRRLLQQTQQQMQGLLAQQHAPRAQGQPIQGWQPDWEQNPGMVALRDSLAQRDQKLQALEAAALGMMNEQDRLQAERTAAKQYENGATLWEKHEPAVEQAFNEALQAGRPASRKDLFALVVARAGDQLQPKGSTQAAQATHQRKRAARPVQVETTTPARHATPTPPKKTMKEMTPEERRAALRGYVEERRSQGTAL